MAMRIVQRFPTLQLPHAVEVAKELVQQRNNFAASNRQYHKIQMGFAVMACQVVRQHFFELSRHEHFPWFRFHDAPGLAYNVTVDGVPLRVQPDCPEIRALTKAEAAELLKHAPSNPQLNLFGQAYVHVLRLEVSQKAGKDVSLVALRLLDLETGEQFDEIILYSAKDGFAEDAVSMKRPPQTPDLSDLFPPAPANENDESID